MARKLSFYDHHRQNYHDSSWRPEHNAHVGEFMIGDYVRSGGVDSRGEMMLSLYRFQQHKLISIQINCFMDGVGTLRALERMGVIEKIRRAKLTDRDDLSQLLINCGLRDRSDKRMVKPCPTS